ncbi:hypothetical protein [Bordetella petrii]|uniref:Phage tail fibre protein n=1 Tax=Bordetella petrii (strain ATCC BAA-461 / DSM 12804 / CCUG 43448 / CIP 107267 / Se-1111R) TaxID=340100 RepID=A9I964_BORPD|nr:hypothetical protein [Bordetella petrii]CAP41333.1 putative phage tail fibre protein [Bordetella petrii]
MFYSVETGGFYSAKMHGKAMPADAVEITDELYSQLLAGQSDGKRIVADESGFPALADPLPPTPAQIEVQKVAVVQKHMDDAARALRYDDIANAVTYAEEPAVPKFQAEGQAFREWRSLVWDKCYAILGEVQAGTRDIPTDEGLIAELPALVLPPT